MMAGFVAERLIRSGRTVTGYNLQKAATVIETVESANKDGNLQFPGFGEVPVDAAAIGYASTALDAIAIVGLLAASSPAAFATAGRALNMALVFAVIAGIMDPSLSKNIDELEDFVNKHLEDFGFSPIDLNKFTDLFDAQAFKDMFNAAGDFGFEDRFPGPDISIPRKQRINDLHARWTDAEATRSPLILDLDGDGVETLGKEDGVYFDHNGDGFAEKTGWAGKDDGLLVRDINGNGQIDTGAELFGNNTQLGTGQKATNGFAALNELDSDGNDRINAGDSAWNTLQVWKDTNGNGVADAGELLTLAQAGVQDISLTYTEAGTAADTQGNQHRQQGSYTTTDGQTRGMNDVWFGSTLWDTTDQRPAAEINAAIAALPDLQGPGTLGSLRQAMARDESGELQALVTQYTSEADPIKRDLLLQDILYHWAGVQNVDPGSRAASIIYGNAIGDARKLAFLERFFGEGYLGTWCWGEQDPNPHGPAAAKLLVLYEDVMAGFVAQLDAQTWDKCYYDALLIAWDDDAGSFKLDASGVVAKLRSENTVETAILHLDRLSSNLRELGDLGNEFLRALQNAGDSQGDELAQILCNVGDKKLLFIGGADDDTLVGNDANNYMRGLSGDDMLQGGEWNDTLLGDEGNDLLYGWSGADHLKGGSGADDLHGGTGNDDLFGGTGNDILDGYDGSDTYHFSRGDGLDTIAESHGMYSDVSGDSNTLQLAEGITLDDLTLTRVGEDLRIAINGTSDVLTIKSQGAIHYGIEQLFFADGTVWNRADIAARASYEGTDGAETVNAWTEAGGVMHGRGGNDTLTGTPFDDFIDGGDGDDTLLGYGTGNDTLFGGEGNDLLYGGSGSDHLEGGGGADDLRGGVGDDYLSGGTGNDKLNGCDGSDTYYFGRGGAQDIIAETPNPWGDYNAISNETDVVLLGEGITSSDVMLIRTGYDLKIMINGTSDSLTIENQGTSYCGIEQLKFADGTVWSRADIAARAGYEGTDEAETVNAWTEAGGVMHGRGGNDTLTGTQFDDSIDGGDGNDALYGDAGGDHLQGGGGADTMMGGTGDDLIDGGVGNDTLNGGQGWYGYGNDTYVFQRGDGQDILTDDDTTVGNIDTVRFLDVRSTELSAINRVNSDLILSYGSSDSLTIAGYFVSESSRIERFEFSDGVVWKDPDIKARAATIGTSGGDNLYGYDDGTNQMFGLDGNDVIGGGAQADWIDGGEGNDRLYGNDGADYLDGGSGDDQMQGGAGDDIYVLDTDGDKVIESSGAGNDTVRSSISYTLGDSIENLELLGMNGVSGTGNALDNRITGNVAANSLIGADGNDILDGGLGADTLTGGAGNDTYIVSTGDTISEAASAGTDTVISDITWTLGSNLENLTLSGTGAINGTGNTLNNTLIGNSAANTLSGGTGADTMQGGAGDDTYVVDNAGDVVTEASNAGVDLVKSSVTYTLSNNVENLTLTGTTAINGIGNALDNILTGNSANNTLTGGAGNDTINGGSGDDTMQGGQGDDTYYVNVATDVVTESANEGFDSVYSTVTLTLAANAEALFMNGTSAINGTGNALNNLVRGNTAANTLNGGSGNDVLEGGAGNDILTDTAGTALFNGGAGTDALTGGAGAEIYLGGLGNDTYTTAGGNDIVLFNKGDGQDTFAAGGTGSDIISLGGSLNYADLTFSKSSNDLVLKLGGTDQITFKNWYASTPSKPVAKLQVIAEAMNGFAQGGSNPLLDQKVENFDFTGLVNAFDAARAANTGLTSWALTNALTSFQLAGSDTAALGGDLAYQYGKNGTLAGIGVTSALSTLSDSTLGSTAQTLTPLSGLQTGSVRLS